MPTLNALHDDEVHLVPDVRGQLLRLLRATKSKVELDTRTAFLDQVSYTIDPANASGNENHFQGIALLADGEHYVASGSNWKTGCGDLFTFHFPAGAAAGSSVLARAVDFPLWHTGGIDCWGNILVVPAECPRFGADFPGRMAGRAMPPDSSTDRSTIFFLFGNNLDVLPPPVRIERPAQLATSTGITRLPDGRFLIIVLSQPVKTAVHVDAYLSHDADLRNGIASAPAWSDDAPAALLAHYQSISLLTDTAGDVYLVGLLGEKKGQLDGYLLGNGLGRPADWTRDLSIPLDVGPADLSAGGSITSCSGQLRLTAISRYRAVKSKKLTITQFVPALFA